MHLVLELGLNGFFRNIIFYLSKNIADAETIYANLDEISFLDKTVLFIYLCNIKTESPNDQDLAKQYHSIINQIKDFNQIRNKLLHGHSIGTYYTKSTEKMAKTKKLLNDKNLIDKQIEKFKNIVNGLKFYFKHINCTIAENGKEAFIKEYLDTSFLNK